MLKVAFFQKVRFQKTILNLRFKFQAQDSFLEYLFFEIWRSEKHIALSEKKPPLTFELTFSALKSNKFAFHLMQIASLTGDLLSSGDFLFMFCFCIWKFLIFSENYAEIPFSVKGKKENRGFLICISLVGCPPACLLKLVNGDARSFPTNT